MNVLIQTERCIGCGHCMDIAPAYFRLGERHSHYVGPQPARREDLLVIKGALVLCPARAIHLLNEYEGPL